MKTQNWNLGEVVKVGFLSLIVLEREKNVDRYKPNAYLLRNIAGDKFYEFVPHNGLSRLANEAEFNHA